MKDGNEDEFLRETWKSIVYMRNAYITHSNKLKRKRNKKRKSKNFREKSAPAPEENISAENISVNFSDGQGSNRTPIVQQAADIILVPATPVPTPVAPQNNIEVQVPVVVKATTTTTTTSIPTKSWAQVATPPKPSPLPAKDQEKEVHQQLHRAVNKAVEDCQQTTKKEKIEMKEKKRKTSSSSSSSKSPSPKKPSKKKSDDVSEVPDIARYQKWIRDWVRAGLNLKVIKNSPNLEYHNKSGFYIVWEGRTRGIFDDWASCKASVDGYKGSKYKKVVGTPIDALKFLRTNLKASPDV